MTKPEVEHYKFYRGIKELAQRLPPALQDELQRYESLRKNLENIQVGLQQVKDELRVVQLTLEELKKQPDDVVTYKAVGQLMFQVDKPKIQEELVEREETLRLQDGKLTKRMESLTEKLQESQQKLQLELSKQDLKLQ